MHLYTNRGALIADYLSTFNGGQPMRTANVTCSYNQSSSTGCRKCGRNISSGSLRLQGFFKSGTASRYSSGFSLGYFHFSCYQVHLSDIDPWLAH
jgi:hypothetical protein